jgi:hypothetical protein
VEIDRFIVSVVVELVMKDSVGILVWVLTLVCLIVVSLVMVDASVSWTEWRDVVELVKVRKLVSNSVDSSEEIIVLVVKVA